MISDVLPAVFASSNSLIYNSNCGNVDLPGKKPSWQGEKESDKKIDQDIKNDLLQNFWNDAQ